MITQDTILQIIKEEKLDLGDWGRGIDYARLITSLGDKKGLLSYSAKSLSADGDKGVELFIPRISPEGKNVLIVFSLVSFESDPETIAEELNEYEGEAQEIIKWLNV